MSSPPSRAATLADPTDEHANRTRSVRTNLRRANGRCRFDLGTLRVLPWVDLT